MAWSPRLQTATSNDSLFNTSSSPSKMCGSSSTMRILVLADIGRCRGIVFHRQSQDETASAAVARTIKDIAAVRAGNLPRQRESKTRALDAAAQGIVRAIELLENLFFRTARDARAAIKDPQIHMRQRLARDFNLHADFFGVTGIFFGIGKQIDNHLSQRITVAVDAHRKIRQCDAQLEI